MSLESTVNEYDRSKLAVWDYPMGLYRYTRVILIDNINPTPVGLLSYQLL